MKTSANVVCYIKRRDTMALRVMNVFNRINVLRGQYAVSPLWLRNKSSRKIVPESEEGYLESIDVPLYKDELPETVLQNRERHLPERGMETPFKDKRRKCVLCAHNIEPDYKNVRLLSQFISGFSGNVYDRHITGLCEKRQKQVDTEITKSRKAGLMPYTFKIPKYQSDPQLFNPAKPIRPHPFW